MKVCPVCNARCFDDMPLCYGCLYHFDSYEKQAQTMGLPALSIPESQAATGLIKPIGGSFSFDQGGAALFSEVEEPVEPQISLPKIEACLQQDNALALQFEVQSQPNGDDIEQAGLAPDTERSDCMLLVVDVGNTHTVLGLFEGQSLEKTWRVTTNKDSTADEIQVLLASLFQSANLSMENINGASLCSVVPRLTEMWRSTLFAIVGEEPVLCTAARAKGLFLADYPNPEEVGQDRVADVIAVRELYGAPAIVVDFGTATNIEIIDEQGRFCGGIIAPGVETSMKALFSNASKLSMVDLDDPGTVIGKNTTHAIQSGIIFGEAERVDGLLRRIFEELGYEPRVIATGGLAGLMMQHSKVVSTTDQTLTLQGLRLLHEHVTQ